MAGDGTIPVVEDPQQDHARLRRFTQRVAAMLNSLLRRGKITMTSTGEFDIPGAAGGTVTSVAQTVPVEFSIAGSPVTSAGTLAISKATQAANKIWSGPTSGAAAAPTFRFLVAADIPSLPYGTGTVTSVAQTVPAEFVISGSPVTTSGTLAITKATQAANLVWAGPTTGSAAQPTFRSLVTADLPSGAGSPLTTKGDLYTFSTVNARLPVGTDTFVLSADSAQATGLKWVAASSGTGTVTSVAQTVPTFLAISGSPVTTSGTLAITLQTQTANFVFAGPTTGADAAPTFRALVAADLPAGAGSPLTTKGDLYAFSTVNARQPIGANGTVLSADSTQTTGMKWVSATTTASPLTTKGDVWVFGAADTRLPIGTDAQALIADSAQTLGMKWGSPSDPITSIYPVFTPAGDSDEFSSGAFSGWTAVNSGSHLPTLTQTNNVLSISHPGGDASAELHAWMKTSTINVNDYIEVAFRHFGPTQSFPLAGLLFADGTTYTSGAQVGFWFSPTETNAYRWSACTGYNTQTSAIGSQHIIDFATKGTIFMRLKYLGSNNWQGYGSCDGISWINITSSFPRTLTPSACGFFVSTWSGALPSQWSFHYFKHSS